METNHRLTTVDADQLSEEEKARQLRLLALRERISPDASVSPLLSGSPPPPPRAGEGADVDASPTGESGDEGEEINAFLKTLVDKRKARHHQLQIIQDFFENPVEFGVEIDFIPSGTPLSEIKTRKKELNYRIKLLNSVLDAFQGELSMLEQAERSALSPADEGAAGPGARTREDIHPQLQAADGKEG